MAQALRNQQRGETQFHDENKILRGIAADFDRAKKALGKDTVEAAVESVKLEEARVQAEKQRKRQYTR